MRGKKGTCAKCDNLRTNGAYCKTHFDEYRRQPKSRWKDSQKGATSRGREYSLTLQEFNEMTRLPCHYCGIRPKNGYVGIDRWDNEVGYNIGNCIPCCEFCNRAKWYFPMEGGGKQTEKLHEWLKWIRRNGIT